MQSASNPDLVRYAGEQFGAGGRRLADIGCGAGRNTIPLAAMGWICAAVDLSWPMLDAARARIATEGLARRVQLSLAPMEWLPLQTSSVDLVVAHGIWNLAATGVQFRRAVREAARIARHGAGLFVFTFSRRTLPAEAAPAPGETFVFTQFSGQPRCFLTAEQLVGELGEAGFSPDAAVPLTELNLPRPGTLRTGGPPVIFQAAFSKGAPSMSGLPRRVVDAEHSHGSR